MCYETDPDFKDHDPHGTNSHIKIRFPDVLAEPSEFHSCSCIWQGTECCFSFIFTLCYALPVGLCHVWVSLAWGLQFGNLLFWHLWCFGPFTQALGYVVHVPASCIRLCVRCVLDPCCEACSYIFMFCKAPPSGWDEGEKGGGGGGGVSISRKRGGSADWDPIAFL